MMKYTFKEIHKCSFCESFDFKILGKRLNISQGIRPHKKRGITTTILKCRKCGLVFANPLPVPENIQDHYSIVPESYWKPEYFIVKENHLEGLIAWMNSIQKVEVDAKILDIGAGLGKNMIALDKKGYDIYGIEPSQAFYERAINKMGVCKERLKLTSVEDCEFDEKSFDVILITAVLEHLYEPAEIIIKIMKWLKPNGLVLIKVPSSDWLVNRLVNIVYKLTGKDYVANLSPMHEPFHLYEFSRKSFEFHAKRSGYEIADFRYYVCQTFLPSILDSILKKYMLWTNTGMELAIWLRKKNFDDAER